MSLTGAISGAPAAGAATVPGFVSAGRTTSGLGWPGREYFMCSARCAASAAASRAY